MNHGEHVSKTTYKNDYYDDDHHQQHQQCILYDFFWSLRITFSGLIQ